MARRKKKLHKSIHLPEQTNLSCIYPLPCLLVLQGILRHHLRQLIPESNKKQQRVKYVVGILAC